MNTILSYIQNTTPTPTKRIVIRQAAKTKRTTWAPHAKYIYRLYLHRKSPAFAITMSNNPRMIAIFNKVARRITAMERLTNTKIDIPTYVNSHFRWFGNTMFPNHLLSSCSWWLYYLRQHLDAIHTYVPGGICQDLRLLKFIAKQRRERERHVFLQLKDSGLFSSRFVKLMDV